MSTSLTGSPRLSMRYRSSVGHISSQDLVQFRETYWKAGGSALVFVGDISLEQATRIGKEFFGSWPARNRAASLSRAAQRTWCQAADFFPFTLADTVWGGGAGARLGTNIREDKAYSYGVFSSPHFYSKYALWVASGGVQTNKTKGIRRRIPERTAIHCRTKASFGGRNLPQQEMPGSGVTPKSLKAWNTFPTGLWSFGR
jgi:predicted Zn-dependent peptidase